METRYTYHASAQFHQNHECFVELEHGAPRIVHFSAPPEFGGATGFWTPEHFLLAAVASCFTATFRALAAASKLEFQGIEVGVEGVLEKEIGGFRFTQIIVRPTVILLAEQERQRTERLLEKAEKACLVTRSLSSAVQLAPRILVENLAAV
jgi:peroxiredoxin-like protein